MKDLADIDRVVSGETLIVRALALRDPETFRAGELRHRVDFRKTILQGYQHEKHVLEWVSSGVNIQKFMKPYKGVFKGVTYDSPSPPKKLFKNYSSCDRFSCFVSEYLLQRVKSGAVHVWGRVGGVRNTSMACSSSHC